MGRTRGMTKNEALVVRIAEVLRLSPMRVGIMAMRFGANHNAVLDALRSRPDLFERVGNGENCPKGGRLWRLKELS